MKIGIDLDDTVWKFHEKFLKFYNERNGTNYDINEYKEYSLENFLDIEKEEVKKLLNLYDATDDFLEASFLEGFLESFLILNKNHEIYFITARPSHTEDLVLKIISKFMNKKPNIYFVHNSETNKRKEKVEYCIELGIDLMIDDAFHNLELCSVKGINGLLINYPWNQKEKLPENIIRVNNWKEIILEVEKYEKQRN